MLIEMWKSSTDSASLNLSLNSGKDKESSKAWVNENIENLQNADGCQIVLVNKVLNCLQDDLSCISKAIASKTLNGELVSETVQNNASCISGSVNSVLPGGLRNCVPSDRHCSTRFISTLEEANTNTDSRRQIQCSEEAMRSTFDFTEKSETSSFREKTAVAAIQNGESFECAEDQGDSSPARLVKFIVDAHTCKCDENSLKGKPSAADHRNQPALDAKNSFDEKEHSTLNMSLDVPVDGTLNMSLDVPVDGPIYLQSSVAEVAGGSGDLVDGINWENVNSCDICGDVGRERLLVVCSNCNDGAEHIYCMKVKMDKVPEGDWRCEECSMMQGIQTESCTEVEKSARALKSYAGKIVQESGKKIFSSSCSSRERLIPKLKYRSSVKRGALDNKAQLAKRSGSFRRTVSSQVLSWKNTEKGEYGAFPASSSDDHSTRKVAKVWSPIGTKSSKFDMKFHERSLSMIKPSKSLDMKLRRQDMNIQEKRKISEVTATYRNKEQPSFRKLNKSMSFNITGKACSDVSDSKAKINEESKYQRHSTGKRIIQRSYSSKSDRPNTYQSQGGFSGARLSINQRTAVSGNACSDVSDSRAKINEESNYQRHKTGKKIIQRSYSSKSDGPKTYKSPGGFSGAKLSMNQRTAVSGKFHSSPSLTDKGHHGKTAKLFGSLSMSNPNGEKATAKHGVEKWDSQAGGRSHCQAKTVVSSDRLKHSPTNRRKSNIHSGSTDNVLQDNLPAKRDFPLFDSRKDAFPRAPIIPNHEYIWKGLFKLEEGGKLPSQCYRMQAYLSTSASPRVSDIVLKFSHDLVLKDFPRMDSWPVRYHKTCPKEEDIALYFFSEDLHSFRDYKNMLTCMVQNDLALKAKFDGIELLILPSNLLPQGSQLWNNFAFLWGVFRGRKATFPAYPPVTGPRETHQVNNSHDINIGKDSPVPTVPGFQPMNSPVRMDGDLYPAGEVAKPNQETDMTNLLKSQSSASAKRVDQSCEAEKCLDKSSCSMKVLDGSANGVHDIPSASNSIKSGQLPGGMQDANEFQDLNQGSRMAFGVEISQDSRKEIAYIHDNVGVCKGIEGHSNGNDASYMSEGPALGKTFHGENKGSAYGMNATQSLHTMKPPATKETFQCEFKDSTASMNATQNLQTREVAAPGEAFQGKFKDSTYNKNATLSMQTMKTPAPGETFLREIKDSADNMNATRSLPTMKALAPRETFPGEIEQEEIKDSVYITNATQSLQTEKALASRETFQGVIEDSACRVNATQSSHAMKAPTPRDTFQGEIKDSAYNMNATQSSPVTNNYFIMVSGASGPWNYEGGSSSMNEYWKVKLEENDAKSKIPDLNLAVEDQIGDEEPNSMDFSSSAANPRNDLVTNYEEDNGRNGASLELSLALPSSSK